MPLPDNDTVVEVHAVFEELCARFNDLHEGELVSSAEHTEDVLRRQRDLVSVHEVNQ